MNSLIRIIVFVEKFEAEVAVLLLEEVGWEIGVVAVAVFDASFCFGDGELHEVGFVLE